MRSHREGVGVVSVLDIVQFPFRSRQQAAQRERGHVDRAAFVEELSGNELEKRAASMLWDLLVTSAVIEDFRPLPDDSFQWMFGLAEEDLDDDIVLHILQELRLPIPNFEEVNAIGPIETSRDLIELVSKAGLSGHGKI